MPRRQKRKHRGSFVKPDLLRRKTRKRIENFIKRNNPSLLRSAIKRDLLKHIVDHIRDVAVKCFKKSKADNPTHAWVLRED